jgi:exopolyphosphatase / guanosine-5'-triphosphate,3'-diphosphate pyrophosphatase
VSDAAGDARDAGPAPAAVIDIGSNSLLLLTVAVDALGRARAVDEALATTRLGSGLRAGGSLDSVARDRTRREVIALAARARAAGARRVWAFGTGALRDAVDGPNFAREVAATARVPVEILSGEREAALAWAAVRAGLAPETGPLVVADVGGRTTELTFGRGDEPIAAASVPLGALALTEAHGADRDAMVAAARRALAKNDLLARARREGARLVVSGGTATALAALDLHLASYAPGRVHGHRLAAVALRALAAGSGAASTLDPQRAAILPAGAVVVEEIAAALGVADLQVSDHGVRHAYLRAALAADGVRADFRALWP